MMERLTEEIGNGYLFKNPDSDNYIDDVADKLGKYEDTGLTPEQIREIDRLYAEKCREVAELKSMLPPCKVGDVVYTIYADEDSTFIETPIVEEVSTHRIWIDSSYFDYDDIGKTVFLTRTEAERHLKKMKGERL